MSAEAGSVWSETGLGKDSRLADYDITMAYMWVAVFSFLLSYLTIFHEIHEAAKDGVQSKKSTRGEWVPETVIAAYDYSLTDKDSVLTHVNAFKMQLSEFAQISTMSVAGYWEKLARRALIWVVVLGTLGGTLYGIFLTVTRFSDSPDNIEKFVLLLSH